MLDLFTRFREIPILARSHHTFAARSIARVVRLSLRLVPLNCLETVRKANISKEPKISERLSVFFVVELKKICQMYYDRVYLCEGQKWDLEREVRKRDYEVQEK